MVFKEIFGEIINFLLKSLPFLALGWAGVAIKLMQRNRNKKLSIGEVVAAMFIGGIFALLAGEVGAWVNMPPKAINVFVFLVGGNAQDIARIIFSKDSTNALISTIFPKFGEFLKSEKKDKEEDK